MKRVAVSLALLCLVLVSSGLADAHGGAYITNHRITRGNGYVRARATYVTPRAHKHLNMTIFLISRERILDEKTKHGSGTRLRIFIAAACRAEAPVYAVAQANTRRGGHFASWQSRRVVCQR